MKNSTTKIFLSGVIVLFAALGGYAILRNETGNDSRNEVRNPVEKMEAVTVFYSPTCGCCSNYISYLEQKGYEVNVVQKTDLSEVKEEQGIPSELQSCHTSVIGDYVVEGHVPTEAIKKLLTERPDIKGIALAGMPSGAPGMGGRRQGPFQINTIETDGSRGGIFMEL